MLTPARTAPPAAPEAPAAERAPRYRRWVLLFALLATVAAVVFPFAPVVQPQVDYRWNAADGAAALPLMPYQPVALTATVECAAVRDGALLLATTPPRPDPTAEPTQTYEQAREEVRSFVGAREGDEVVFTRNTTDSFNLLARALPRDTAVFTRLPPGSLMRKRDSSGRPLPAGKAAAAHACRGRRRPPEAGPRWPGAPCGSSPARS